MRVYPTIDSWGREGKQVAPSVPKEDVPKAKACFYALRTRGSKLYENDDDDVCKLVFLLAIWVPSKWASTVSRSE